MIKLLKKLHAEKGAGYRFALRYQGEQKWHVCELLDVDNFGIAVMADGETIGVPWTGLAAVSFRPQGN